MDKDTKKSGPIGFLHEVLLELDLVKWPNRQETIRLTTIVIVSSVLVGAYIGSLDYLLVNLLTALISR